MPRNSRAYPPEAAAWYPSQLPAAAREERCAGTWFEPIAASELTAGTSTAAAKRLGARAACVRALDLVSP